MKKTTLILFFINFTILFLFIIVLELFSYIKYCNAVSFLSIEHKKINKDLRIRYSLPVKFDINNFSSQFTDYTGAKSGKRPVILFGCSYTVGNGLNKEDTFDYKLHVKTERPVYKRAVNGGGPQIIYHILSSGLLQKQIHDAQYLIYVFTPSHLYLIDNYQMSYIKTIMNLRYKIKNGKLEQVNPFFPISYSSFLIKNIQANIENCIISKHKSEDKTFDKFNFIMSETIKQSRIVYPNSRFIILEYPNHRKSKYDPNQIDILPEDEKEYLRELGYEIINLNDLTKSNLDSEIYKLSDKEHPNGKTWDKVVPALISFLEL